MTINYLGKGGVRYGLQTAKGAEQTTQGRYLAINGAFPARNTVAQIDENVAFGSDYTLRRRPGQITSGGPYPYALRPNMAFELGPYGVLGFYEGIAALTADTVKAATPVTTDAAGISTITLTTGNAAIVPGMIGLINTAANQEPFQVHSYNPSTKVIKTVLGRTVNRTAAAATPVTWELNHHMAPRSAGDGTTDFPYWTFEDFVGDPTEAGYSWRRPDCLISAYALTQGGAGFVQASSTISPSHEGRRISSPSAWDAPPADENDQGNEYTFTSGGLVVGNDQSAGGTSVFSFLEVNSWGVTMTRRLRTPQKQKNINGILSDRHIENEPLDLMCSMTFEVDNEAKRNSFEEDYILQQQTNVGTPFGLFLALNLGTPGAPSWQAYSYWVEQAMFDSAPSAGGPQDVETIAATLRTEPVSGFPQAEVFVMNDTAALTV